MSVVEKEKVLQVSGSTDVLVVGAGIAGVAAALASARSGAKTMLIEREYAPGGMATLGLIAIYLPLCDGCGHQVVYGIGEELLKLSIQGGAEADYPSAWLDGGTAEEKIQQRFKVRFNPHLFALRMEQLLLDAGVDILYGTAVCDTIVEDGRIQYVVIENKSGRSAVRVKTVVDCSGDADVCKFAGAETYLNPKGNGLADWYYYFRDGKVDLNMFGLADVIPEEREAAGKTAKCDSIGTLRFSGVDGRELSDAVITAHARLYENVLKRQETDPDFVPVCMSSIPLVRMSRRIVGETTMEAESVNRYVEDSIGMTGDWTKRGPVYEIPFSALYNRNVRNLITAGRNISTSEPVWNVTRVIPPAAVTGQAAGTAAAIFDDFVKADVSALQTALRNQGVKLHISEVTE